MSHKVTYRIRNWPDYNRSLIARGDISLWLNGPAIKEWYEKDRTLEQGRPRKYSDHAIISFLIIKSIFKLDLRRTQGLLQSIFKLIGWKVAIPSYTQVCRRQKSIKLPKLSTLQKEIHLVVDSSGLKVFGEGEWKVRQHGYDSRRTWRKIHLGIDEKSQLIVSAELTKNSCGDDKVLPNLLSSYQGKITQVSADGAYDSHACFDAINEIGAIPTIPTQPNPMHKPKIKSKLRNKARDHVAWKIQEMGRRTWKICSSYHRRSLVETCFSRFKGILGGQLKARIFDNQEKEALIKCHILNRLTSLGLPKSIALSERLC